MKLIKILLPLLLSVNCFGQTHKLSQLSQSEKNKINQLFSNYDKKSSPGYAIGIVKRSNLLYARGYGSANLDYGLAITPNSSFDIASVSKQFTAACIALLIMDGKINLDMPASNFVPQLAKYKDTIRIKHLIYNTSGIIDYYKLPRPDGKSWITFNYFDNDYCIKVSLNPDTLVFKPGERWDYCNVNYMLLAKIVEKVSGQSFGTFCNNRLFKPLGMNNTIVNDDITTVIKNRVTPYNTRTKEYVDAYKKEGINVSYHGEWIQHARNSPHYGGSGVVTTINDLAKWSGNFFTRKFGGDQFYNLMHKTLKFHHDMDNQAFGLYFGKYKNRNYVAWDGGDYGVSSQLIRFPDKNIAIIVLSNIGSGKAAEKANQIADVLMANGSL